MSLSWAPWETDLAEAFTRERGVGEETQEIGALGRWDPGPRVPSEALAWLVPVPTGWVGWCRLGA